MAARVGISGIPMACAGQGFEAAIRWLSGHGLCEEVQFVRSVWMTPQKARYFAELNKSLKVPLSIHAPYYINLCNPAKVAASKARILASAKVGEILGADVVVFHPGFYGGDKARALELVTKGCREMARETSVLLGLETMGRQAQFGTLDEINAVCHEVKGCVPVLDFAHMYARNNGSIDYGAVLDKVRHLRHLHSHFTSVNYGNGNERNHLPISHKQPDFAPLAKEITRRKLDITIICESPMLEHDALRMRKMLGG
jgi:deoxyribonuclease-4